MKQQQQSNQQQQQQSIPPHPHGQLKVEVVNPEVMAPTERRRYTAADKERILAEADRCTQPGEVGALLRREGLYSSHLTRWRAQRRRGELSQPSTVGRHADPQAAEVRRLQQENERLKSQLARAEVIIEAQKKLCQLLNLPLSPEDER